MRFRGKVRVLLINAKASMAAAITSRADLDAVVLSEERYRDHFASCGCADSVSELTYTAGNKLSPRAVASVRQAIETLRPDVVHAFYPRALAHTVLATFGMRERPKIVSYRGVTSPLSRLSPIQRMTYLSRKVDLQACESDAVRQCLVSAGVPADRCEVAFNCLTSPVQSCDRSEARRVWGVPDDAFVVAMTANMRPVKGADVLMEAALLCAGLANVHFVLMGHANDERVQKLAADPRARRVHLTGFLPDAGRLVSAADLFVMPSRAEALSVALLEAMMQGVCPVVSDAGGMKEAVRHGRDGMVFPSEDSAALARAIRILHALPEVRQRMGESAQKRAATEFSAAAVARRLAAVYQRAAGDVAPNVLRRVA